ncbi:alpha/beta fold hydrolase [Rhodococcus aetherivorans]
MIESDAGAGSPSLLLAHGSALSSAIWRGFGYVRPLRERYRLILPDLRGHGRSDKPHVPDAYAMDLIVGDVLAVLDAAGTERVHYLGYSFGARVGLSLAVRDAAGCRRSPWAAAVPARRPGRSIACSSRDAPTCSGTTGSTGSSRRGRNTSVRPSMPRRRPRSGRTTPPPWPRTCDGRIANPGSTTPTSPPWTCRRWRSSVRRTANGSTTPANCRGRSPVPCSR